MHIQSIHLEHFMGHDLVDLDLPDRGAVVITGRNGSGKSSFVEAVSYAFWGKTLRGTDPWRTGEAGLAEVKSDTAEATRRVTAGGTNKLTWSPGADVEPVQYDTSKKARDALLAYLGEWDRWRRTHVFSSQDATHFTMASDGERKHLLESLLGLDRFDAAFSAASEERKQVKRDLADAAAELGRAAVHYDLAKAAVASFDTEPEESEPPKPPPITADDVKAAEQAVLAMELQLEASRNDQPHVPMLTQIVGDALVLHNEAVRLQREYREAFSTNVCGTCGNRCTDEQRAQAFERLENATKAAQDALDKEAVAKKEDARLATEFRTYIGGLQAQLRDARSARDKAHALMFRNEQYDLAYTAWSKRVATAKARRAKLVVQLSSAEDVWSQYADRHFGLELDLKGIEAVCSVFGLRGVRARVLGDALDGIEVVANVWMSRLADSEFRVKLKPYTENKSGTVRDAINLEVEGAGNGLGYKAASGGERRRIDTALLLALSSVAAAAYGSQPGTLFMDEVFDALDEDGRRAAVDVISELALDRCVVVVTHDTLLAATIPAVQRVSL